MEKHLEILHVECQDRYLTLDSSEMWKNANTDIYTNILATNTSMTENIWEHIRSSTYTFCKNSIDYFLIYVQISVCATTSTKKQEKHEVIL